MTLRLPFFFFALLMWACGDPPLDYVDLSAYQAEENAEKEAKQKAEQAAWQSLTTFVDFRDGQIYKQVTIGSQTWMAQNLNYMTENSFCIDNDPVNCSIYGRLYIWDAAMVACPSGWHLPDTTEWKTLLNAVGGQATAGTVLKSQTGWYWYCDDSRDAYGFSALPTGAHNRQDDLSYRNDETEFWSSSGYISFYAEYDCCASTLFLGCRDFETGLSYDNMDHVEFVRCIKDSP